MDVKDNMRPFTSRQNCDRWKSAPDVMRNPMLLWERFPCPPPGTDHSRVILELDWTGYLGISNGCEALTRVARRCSVDLKHSVIPPSLTECKNLFDDVGLCGTMCIIAMILAVIVLLLLLLLMVVCRKYLSGTKSKSSTIYTNTLPQQHMTLKNDRNRYCLPNLHMYYPQLNYVREEQNLYSEVLLLENGNVPKVLRDVEEPFVYRCNLQDLSPQCGKEARRNILLAYRPELVNKIVCLRNGDYVISQIVSRDLIAQQAKDYQYCNKENIVNVSNIYEHILSNYSEPIIVTSAWTSPPEKCQPQKSFFIKDNLPIDDTCS